jgi:hypothetical protein
MVMMMHPVGIDRYGFLGPIPIPLFLLSALADDRYGLPIFLSRYLEPILLLLPQFTSKKSREGAQIWWLI